MNAKRRIVQLDTRKTPNHVAVRVGVTICYFSLQFFFLLGFFSICKSDSKNL